MKPVDAKKLQAKAMLEGDLQTCVMTAAKYRGWRAIHFRTALTARGAHVTALAGDKGFPDLVLTRPPRLLFVELKSEAGALAPDQKAWRDALLLCDAEWYLWRPRDWFDGTIETALCSIWRPDQRRE